MLIASFSSFFLVEEAIECWLSDLFKFGKPFRRCL